MKWYRKTETISIVVATITILFLFFSSYGKLAKNYGILEEKVTAQQTSNTVIINNINELRKDIKELRSILFEIKGELKKKP